MQDVIISFVLASVLALVGILSAYVAVQWARLEGNDTEIGADVLSRALNVLAATAVSKQQQRTTIIQTSIQTMYLHCRVQAFWPLCLGAFCRPGLFSSLSKSGMKKSSKKQSRVHCSKF